MPLLWPDIAWELIRESNKTIFWGEAMRLTDLPAGSWSGSGHLNQCPEAVDASPHPNESVEASHFDLNVNWDGLPGDTKGIYRLRRKRRQLGRKRERMVQRKRLKVGVQTDVRQALAGEGRAADVESMQK